MHPGYVHGERLRLEAYRKIAAAQTAEDLPESGQLPIARLYPVSK
jgi:hypothetical protein